ncbi:acetylornithine deacetylase [Mobilicoccus pelagius]|uniref:Acetylornithine deacetylase n=1 Tax=Mobilicoccus pelagius NBRC 104925 TaxID=1089455 RepID=H5UUQ1_9MICO|nr:acetylornithine deacetylase [Mobilicoccus pelagius]GAB49459.1 acetylornithine deacetylase [Mobilicoccus pelagius NBRC 104925]
MQQTQQPESLAWIEKLVAIDTTSRDSNLPLVDLVAAELRERGLELHVFPDATGQKANLVATVPAADGSRNGGVVLSAHTDVVPVDGQEWSSDPFTTEIRDGRLYGRGTCDMKGFLGVALHTLPRMLEAELTEPIHLALTYDEEVGCVGGGEIVKQFAEIGLDPRACIVGEPSMMHVIGGHKSMNVVRFTFCGVAAHSSRTPYGVNAIEYASRFVCAVRERAEGWRDEGPRDEAYGVPYTTASVNLVSGGIAGNTVPDRCSVQLEFRSIGADDPEEILGWMREVAGDLEREMKAENDAARVEVEILAQAPGFDAPHDSATARLAVELGAIASEEKVNYGTEAGQYAGAGIDTVVCGPGDIAQAHTADEYVELSQLVACEEFMNALVDRLSRTGDSSAHAQ